MLIQRRRLTGLFLLSRLFLICFLFTMTPHQGFAAEKTIDYILTPAGHSGFIIDTRDAVPCETASLNGARCLPARDFLGPHKRLANFSGLLWLLGTTGLTGEEHVLVVGDQSTNKEFMAGVLYLAGQRKISVLMQSLNSQSKDKLTPGITRSKTRENVYQAAMRNDRIVLRSDLVKMLRSGNAPVLLDGRGESEYWGQAIRASRGGHLPGAQHLPATSVLPGRKGPPLIYLDTGEYAVAYAHNSYESIVFLARLIAMGVEAKMLLEGWAGWASDGSLPADSVTYADQRASVRSGNIARKTVSIPGMSFIVLAILAGIGLFAAGYYVRRARAG